MNLVGTTIFTCGRNNGTWEVAKYSTTSGTLLWNATDATNATYHFCVLEGNFWTIGVVSDGHLAVTRWSATGVPTTVGMLDTFTWPMMGGCDIWTDGVDVYAMGGALNSSWMNGRRPILVKYSAAGALLWNTSLVMTGSELHGLSGHRAGSRTQVFVIGINATSMGEIACVGDDGVQKWVAPIPGLTSYHDPRTITTSGQDVYICGMDADQISLVNMHVPLPAGDNAWIAIVVACSFAAVIVVVVIVASKRARSTRI